MVQGRREKLHPVDEIEDRFGQQKEHAEHHKEVVEASEMRGVEPAMWVILIE